LILSGGLGTRLRPLTYSQQKQLIPVANKPILFYAIDDLIDANIHDIGIIVGPNKNLVIETVMSVEWDANIRFIQQETPLGIAHAIKISKDFIGDDSFILYLGDNILKGGVVDQVTDFKNSDCECSIFLMKVDNPEAFGIALLNDNNEVVKLIEKPKKPLSNLAVIGVYLFRSKVFNAVEEIKPSNRNLLEITDAIQWLIDHDYKVKSTLVTKWWKDTGKPEDILEANRLILDDLDSDQSVKVKGKIRGRVSIGKGTKLNENSVIKGPAIIGRDCLIKDSYIGPYTSIGNNCKIFNSELEDSVVMDGVMLVNIGNIIDSLIGRDVTMEKNSSVPKGNKFIIGDNSQVRLE